MYLPLIAIFMLGFTFSAAQTSSFTSPLAATTTSFFFAPLTFTFNGGPAFYTMKFAADGQFHSTDSELQISLIDTNGYDAYSYCNFYGPDYVWNTGIAQSGSQLAIGPPQEIAWVECANWPGGGSTCLPEYSNCEWNSNQGGQYILPCCGFCMASKCRSFNPP